MRKKESTNQKISLKEPLIASKQEKEKNGCLKNMPLMSGLMKILEKMKDSNNKWEDKLVLLPTSCLFVKYRKFSAALDLILNFKVANLLKRIMFMLPMKIMKFNLLIRLIEKMKPHISIPSLNSKKEMY